ncbi:MAG TPA: leucine-rich repeat domain-containing protein [Verrucomicrobiae bacterium]|nr:leucine-rich repeat domain-containing protein [Verrucomicrobiae bacterium]
MKWVCTRLQRPRQKILTKVLAHWTDKFGSLLASTWLVPLVALVASAIGAEAQYTVVTNGATVAITQYSGPGGSVVIPSIINGFAVAAIGPQAFGFNATITNVTIPASVLTIGAGAFTDCTGLTGISIGNKVGTINDNAFFNCTSLAAVQLPNSVTNVGIQAFYNCVSLTTVSIPPSLISIGKEAFNFCIGLTSITLSSGVTNIGDFAFDSCKSLNAITVDQLNPAYSSLAGVLFDKTQSTLIQCPGAKIGSYAVPNGVTTIAGSAFRNCDNLTTITIPNSVTNIGSSAFSLCFNLTSITVDPLNPFYSSVAGVLFDKSQTTLLQCPSATPGSYTLPASVTNLGPTALIGCRNLTAISADPQNQAFSGLGGVLFDKTHSTLIQFPEALTGSYTVPSGVVRLGDFSFVSCAGLTNVNLASTVTDIGVAAFAGCSGLNGLTIPNSVTNIGLEAFEACTKVSQVNIGKGLSSIGSYLFYQCASLTNVAIPDTIQNIADRAFQACTSLSNVTVGAGVTNIGALAFGFCPNLGSVFFRGDAPATDPSAFANDAAAVYFLFGTRGWGPRLSGLPTALWNPQISTQDSLFGARSNTFGFHYTGPTNLMVVVETCTDLTSSAWTPLQTNMLSGGAALFNNPLTNTVPVRFYRIRSL